MIQSSHNPYKIFLFSQNQTLFEYYLRVFIQIWVNFSNATWWIKFGCQWRLHSLWIPHWKLIFYTEAKFETQKQHRKQFQRDLACQFALASFCNVICLTSEVIFINTRSWLCSYSHQQLMFIFNWYLLYSNVVFVGVDCFVSTVCVAKRDFVGNFWHEHKNQHRKDW